MDGWQPTRRYLGGLSLVALAVVVLTGCGSDQDAADRTAARDEPQAVETIEDQVEAANKAVLRAARTADRSALARAERSLTALREREDAAEEPEELSDDPFEREIDRFGFKRAPLFAQQITSSESDHVLFVSVFRPQFCLKTTAERLGVVREVYVPMDRRLRREHAEDFEMLVVPLKETGPTRREALAVGKRGTVSLTKRGQNC